MRWFTWLILLTIIIAGSWAAMRWLNPGGAEQSSQTLTVVKPAKQTMPDFRVTAVQAGDQGRQVINCAKNRCQPLPAVDSVTSLAVTDGVSWYHYQYKQDERTGREILQLRRTWIDSKQSDLITEETPLVKPRGLYISPDNQRIAFWLDGENNNKKPLTELWVYNAAAKGKLLVAEKIVRTAVLSLPRWNRASSLLWFVGETGQANEPSRLAVHVAAVNPPSFFVSFADISLPSLDDMAVDLSLDGKLLALAEPQDKKTLLKIYREESDDQSTTLFGAIPYLQWLDDGSLLYAVQGQNAFTLWHWQKSVHRHVVRQQGVLESIRADRQGKYLVMSVRHTNEKQRVYAVNVQSGQSVDQGEIPPFGDKTYLVQFETSQNNGQIAGVNALDDEQIIAFIENYLERIAQEPAVLVRMVITDKANTVFVDYRTVNGEIKRLLITVLDVLHSEWSILARYVEKGREWVKMQGGGLADPEPARLYEWEEDVRRWILKPVSNNQ